MRKALTSRVMLRSIYASNRPVVLLGLILPLVLTAILSGLFIAPHEALLAGPAYDLLSAPVHNWKWLSLTLGAGCIFFGAVLLNNIYNEHEFSSRANYLPALAYTLFAISLPESLYFNPIYLANLLLLLALRRLFRIYRISNATPMLFDSGLLLGIAVLIYPPLFMVLPFLWIGMAQLRTGNIREWLVPLAGLMVPGLYAAAAYWWFETEPVMVEFLVFQRSFDLRLDQNGGAYAGYLAVLIAYAVPAFLGLNVFIRGMASSTVHRKNTRRSFLFFSLLLLIVWLYMGFLSQADGGNAGILAVSLAVFSAQWFSSDFRKWLVSLPFYVWIICIVVHLAVRFIV